jgi:hypothetical protein
VLRQTVNHHEAGPAVQKGINEAIREANGRRWRVGCRAQGHRPKEKSSLAGTSTEKNAIVEPGIRPVRQPAITHAKSTDLSRDLAVR